MVPKIVKWTNIQSPFRKSASCMLGNQSHSPLEFWLPVSKIRFFESHHFQRANFSKKSPYLFMNMSLLPSSFVLTCHFLAASMAMWLPEVENLSPRSDQISIRSNMLIK